jgi:hypothetical protein
MAKRTVNRDARTIINGGSAMVRIRRKLDSETLHIPELRPLLGKTVDIIVEEETLPGITPGTSDWEAAERAARNLRDTNYDFDAWRQQREVDLTHARDHLL